MSHRDGRPNILVLMADQLTPSALPAYGHPIVRAPAIQALADEGVVFDAAYCNFPLCAPARAALMSGRLASRIEVFDNAAEFSAEVPTFAHALRLAGYRTVLAGKMHFCGADQLHGFERRLTTDIYPADFAWTPDWDRPHERLDWYHNMTSVLEAGVAIRTNQLDFDDEVVFTAERELFAIARGDDRRPFLLVASLTHPHDPFAIPAEWWDLYEGAEIPLPRVTQSREAADPHSRRVRDVCDIDAIPLSEDQIRAARRAYYGAISYVDAQFARLRQALIAAGLADDTVIIVLSDHGEMLGERGLWYKMSFFEGASRIPLIIHQPRRFRPRRVREAVSAIDLLPTLLELATAEPLPTPIEGRSLLPHLMGEGGHDLALGEYLAEGALAPIVMIRRGRHKFVHSPADPDQLYDLEDDPDERRNLAADPGAAALIDAFRAEVAVTWDLGRLHEQILASQRRRRLVLPALRRGEPLAWDYQPRGDANRRYVRGDVVLDELEAAARFPRVR